MARGGHSYIGTSGWQYPDFKRRFYPEEVPSAGMLAYYSERLDAVEVNSTFYHFSRPTTYAKWRDTTRDGFLVAVKANRYFTHDNLLEDPEGRMEEFMTPALELGARLGPVLFQLPPSLERDETRLKAFLRLLPKGPRYTIEFRNPSWDRPSVYKILEKANIALCIHDIRQRLSPVEVTAEFVYARLHGPLRSPYRGSYSDEALSEWAERLSDWNRAGMDAFLFFDNTMQGDAIDNALAVKERVRGMEKRAA